MTDLSKLPIDIMQELVLNTMPVRVFWKDTEFRYMGCNKNFAIDAGFALPKEVIGKTDFDIYSNRDATAFREDDIQILRSGESKIRFEEPLTLATGETIILETSKIALKNSNGKTVGLMGTYHDITARKRLESDAIETERRLNEGKSQFLANMSHEIRTPMNGIMGLAEVLKRSALAPEQARLAEIIHSSGTSLLCIIDDILNFSKLSAGKTKLQLESHNLGLALEEVGTVMSSKAAEKNLDILVRIAPDLPEEFMCDIGRIRQIATNLLSNAIKFSKAGDITMRIWAQKNEEAKANSSHMQVNISVQDEGIGMSEPQQAIVFEQFTQIDNTARREYSGTGLGLAICKSLVELMEGEMTVESEQGKGSTFSLSIPLQPKSLDGVCMSQRQGLRGRVVLVIDRHEQAGQARCEQLKQWGIQTVQMWYDKDQTYLSDNALFHKGNFDAVIINPRGERKKSLQIIRTINKNKHLSKTPLIVLNNVDRLDLKTVYARLGVSAQITKPVKRAELFEILLDLCTSPSVKTHNILAIESQSFDVNSVANNSVNERLDILVAEDNLVNQIVISEFLKETNYTFKIADNGRIAVKMYEEYLPQMVLMDVSMPEMTGLEAACAIRQLEVKTGQHTAIVAVTAHVLQQDLDKCLEAGMDDTLVKPLSKAGLFEKIEQWMPSMKSVEIARMKTVA